jgi:hypothetical protein
MMNGEAFAEPRSASAMSASVPPSPLLSARMRKMTYFSVTTMNSDQRTSDRMPKTMAGVMTALSAAAMTASRKA